MCQFKYLGAIITADGRIDEEIKDTITRQYVFLYIKGVSPISGTVKKVNVTNIYSTIKLVIIPTNVTRQHSQNGMKIFYTV